jgi:F420-0:gamma-glutamyl ligase-like protein
MKMRLAFILIAMFFSSPSFAGFYTGNDLYVSCSSNKQLIWGFVAGSFDKSELDFGAIQEYSMATLEEETKEQMSQHIIAFIKGSSAIKGYCEPRGIDLSQVSDIYCKFLTANPAKRHLSASALFNEAISEAWPCGAKK